MDQHGIDTLVASRDLYDAAFDYDVVRVRQLLTVGVRVVSDDRHEQQTALHAVCWLGDSLSGNTLEQEIEAFVKGDTVSGSIKCAQIVEMLLGAGADVNAADEHGNTPLHTAVAGDWANATAVRTLLRAGALVDLPNADGEAPMMKD